jgi:pimeloyl-ACP methyl ester carboxylesterase
VPAHLYHELIAGTAAQRGLALAHGIYGSGANWRAIARKLVEKRPDVAVALIDLRHHGRSIAADPPDTLAACADDLRAAIGELAIPVAAIAGHSFGGKVALATRPLMPALRQTWVFDASPSAQPDAMTDRDNSVIAVLELMERLPKMWARRDDFVAAVVDAGQSRPLAQWLAMNVVADGDRYVLRLELPAIRAMLADYVAQDVWAAVLAPAPGDVHVVIADRSDVIGPADRRRLDAAPPHVHVHHVDAGHWLHIEAPGTVVDMLAVGL